MARKNIYCAAGCGRLASSIPCPVCFKRVCLNYSCFTIHGENHLIKAGMTPLEARLAMKGDYDSLEERAAIAMAMARLEEAQKEKD